MNTRRVELGKSLNLIDQFIPLARPNRPGVPLDIKFITIHNTSNANKNADALAHSNFVRKTGFYRRRDGKEQLVSWHYTVDDRIVIKQIPISEIAFHAGRAANKSSIAIEVCMHEGIDQYAANIRAAKLVAILCYDLFLSLDSVVTHKHWTGKNCPVLLLAEWDKFKYDVQGIVDYLIEGDEETATEPESYDNNKFDCGCFDLDIS